MLFFSVLVVTVTVGGGSANAQQWQAVFDEVYDFEGINPGQSPIGVRGWTTHRSNSRAQVTLDPFNASRRAVFFTAFRPSSDIWTPPVPGSALTGSGSEPERQLEVSVEYLGRTGVVSPQNADNATGGRSQSWKLPWACPNIIP